MELFLILGCSFFLFGVGCFFFLRWRKKQSEKRVERRAYEASLQGVNGEPKESEIGSQTSVLKAASNFSPPQVLKGLERTRGAFLSRLAKLLSRSGGDFGASEWSEFEEALLEGDVGVQTSTLLIERVKERAKNEEGISMRRLLVELSGELFSGVQNGELNLEGAPKPLVISIVGVNGVGKTTTIGKLAKRFSQSGKTVLLGAADTFRAGAISQLKVWADRSNADFVTGREGADPGAVAFDSITAAKARNMDVVILDTAGRLHTKDNLMEELKKVHRVVKKVIADAPHERWMVIDGTLGQNSVQQAKEFHKALDLTGIIVTKLDGTAKGGALLSIANELKLPVRFIGVGEAIDDLIPFNPKPFVEAILGEQ